MHHIPHMERKSLVVPADVHRDVKKLAADIGEKLEVVSALLLRSALQTKPARIKAKIDEQVKP